MKAEHFLKEAGLKVLAISQLSQCEYSIVLYLLNTSLSGLSEFVTNEVELASLTGYDEATLRNALKSLQEKNIIQIHHSIQKGAIQENTSMRIGLIFNVKRWKITSHAQKDMSANDALVFPFRRKGSVNLQVIDTPPRRETANGATKETWQRVFQSFIRDRSLDERELEREEEMAKILVETHPIDQLLLLIRHFGQRIPNLNLLASSWQHYQELFESETQNVDIMGARKKYLEMDDELRKRAEALLNKDQTPALTDEEKNVLSILIKHRHPRRQLFWAYQLRSRYPNLNAFFENNLDYMLAVKSNGKIVKRPHSET